MDKAVLKKFAIESRQDLMQRMENKIKAFYIDEEFSKQQSGDVYILANAKHSLNLSKEEYDKRELLIKRINELGLDQVIEEAAYTWFNRIVAIRYMEIHDYLPLTRDNQSLGVRVLSSKDNTPDPEIMKFTNLVNPDLDIDFKKEKYVELKDNNEKFKYILLLVCKKLGRVITQVFDGVTDYIDILIPDNLLNDMGFITKIINEIPENNYNQVEIIGWLYQYYISEKKELIFEKLRKNIKIDQNSIPAATQIFTPEWIVKYMVENSLCSYIESNNQYDFQYYIGESNKHKCCNSIENIKVIDPCCGSGHILVYAFEVLYKMYDSLGFNKNDIPIKIIQNNLFGIDIDDRACQLANLSVFLKAREFDKNLFNKIQSIESNIIAIPSIGKIDYNYYSNYSITTREIINKLCEDFKYSKEYGSLIKFHQDDYSVLYDEIEHDNSIFGLELRKKFFPAIKCFELLKQKYDIVITNPPYIGSKGLSDNLRKFLSINYQEGKYDTYSSFILKCIDMTKENGYIGMMTPNTWMFINTYKNLRNVILNYRIESLLHLSNKAFNDAAVIITSFVIQKRQSIDNKNARFVDLKDYDSENIKNNFKEFAKNKSYYVDCKMFKRIPNNTFTYWLSNAFIKNLDSDYKIGDVIISDGQTKTGDNDKYLRMLWEVDKNKIGKNCKWNIHAKGGEYRRWYGNLDTVIDWSQEARKFYKEDKVARITPEYLCFRKGITWTLLCGSNDSFRLLPNECTFNCVGPSVFFEKEEELNYILGLLNSKVAKSYINGFNPTLSLTIGDVSNIPLIKCDVDDNKKVDNIVKENIKISKEDWDSFETSWDFTRNPLLKHMSKVSNIRDSLANWNTYTYQQRSELKHNEEELNKIFIDIYGLNDELTPTVDDKDITIRKEDNIRDIKSFISYAVGCMFGRYSLDKNGLIYAGGDFDKVYQKCKKTDGGWAGSSISNYKYLNDNGNEIELSFEVDNDNIIPITDEAYFSDDIVERFKTFIKTVYGDNTFNENMDFIAETLGKKEIETSEETIRRYFVNDFFNDHVKMYQKRPIYWLLDSGKKNGFKALIYMHRYNENLIPKARLDYLHRIQTTYENLLSDINYKLTTDLSMVDKKNTLKRQADLNAKLQEIKEYDEKIAHIANQRISIDLDDRVKVNYGKFKDILAKIK